MFGFDEDFRKGRMPSLLGLAPARPALGEDAALRHERARMRRERKASPLLAALPPAQPAPRQRHGEDAGFEDEVEPRPAPRRRLRGLFSGRKVHEEEPAPAELAGELEWADLRGAPAPPATASFAPDAPSRRRAAPGAPRRPVSGKPRRAVVALTLTGAALGAALAFAWPKTYVATSEMLVDPRGAQQSGAAALSPDAAFALVDNQLRVLRSGTMLGAVAERLNLGADPEFNGAGGALSALGDLVSGDGAAAMEGRRRHVVEALAKAVRVERSDGSSVLAVSAGTSDPHKSALIANTISELFLAGSGHTPANPGEAAGEMADRLAGLRAGVEAAERAVEAYKAENELVDAQGRLITDDEIVRLGEQLSAARARTVELNARAASTREADIDSIVTGSLPEQYASPTLTELRTRYAELKQQLDRVSVKLGPRHPERLAAQAEIEGARQEISGELRRVASALQTELRRAVQQEQELAAQLAQMKVRQGGIGDELVALRELEREAEARRSAYERALRTMAADAAAPAAGSVSLISRAEPPLRASGPSVAAFSMAGALAGLLAGLGYAGRRRTDEPEDREAGAPPTQETGKEADQMYPYSPYPQQTAYPQQAAHPQQAPAYPQPFPQAQPAPYVQPAPMHYAPQPHAQPPAPYPAAYAQPPAPSAGWPPAPYAPPAYAAYPQPPMMPVPHDPWAHMRPYAPPPPPAYPAAAYAPAPPVHTVVYMPAPQAQPAPAQPQAAAAEPSRQAAPRRPRQDERRESHDAFVDERTDAAIEEIRRSLREFRDAIEDYAGEHDEHRRYGT